MTGNHRNRVFFVIGAAAAVSSFVWAGTYGSGWAVRSNNRPTPYYGSYSRYGRGHSHSIISLELDAKKSLDSEMRIAAREERIDDVQKLLHRGADVNSAADEGETALMYASRNCSVDTARVLIENHAKINQRDNHGRTALTYAVRESCLPIVKLLLKDHRTRTLLKDDIKLTAMDYAQDATSLEVDGPAYEIVRLLKRAGKSSERSEMPRSSAGRDGRSS